MYKYVSIILLLIACKDAARPYKNAKLKANYPLTMECIQSDNEPDPMVFCVDGDHLIICSTDECLVYAPH